MSSQWVGEWLIAEEMLALVVSNYYAEVSHILQEYKHFSMQYYYSNASRVPSLDIEGL